MKPTNTFFLASLIGGSLALAASGANAHTLDGAGGLVGGLAHPFMGLDHLLAMIAVGLWAAQLGRQALWQVPLAFVAVMAIGFGLSRLGFGIPLAEPMVVASVAVLGAIVAGAVRMPVGVGAALVSVFAVFHGFAHGIEMPGASSAWGYAAGFVIATASLHWVGLGLGMALRQRPVAARLGGAAISITGVALMVVGL
jgi:urease accessory protein